MDKINDPEKGKDNPINQKLISASINLSDELSEEEDKEKSCLFFKIIKFQTIFGVTYGLSQQKLESKTKKYLLIFYELIILFGMSNYYIFYLNQNDDFISKFNTKTFAVSNFIRISAHSCVIISGFVFKIIIFINGTSILKVMRNFRENQRNHELKVILILHI